MVDHISGKEILSGGDQEFWRRGKARKDVSGSGILPQFSTIGGSGSPPNRSVPRSYSCSHRATQY